jgi:hypothetical protein
LTRGLLLIEIVRQNSNKRRITESITSAR